MNYGMHISASGMAANMARQDVLSNNLANASTVGFKPDVLSIRQRDPARVEDRLMSLPSNELLERLGAGVMPMATSVDLTQGALEMTGSELDVGLEGTGFLVVRAGPGAEGLRVTRDGRLATASDGTLVTANEGLTVLGEGGQPIRVDRRVAMRIDADGVIRQDGEEVGRLQVSDAANPRRLVKAGANLLRAAEGSGLELAPSGARVRQGHVEGSATNAIDTMMKITDASRAVQANSRIIGIIDDLMDAAVNRLGRVN